MYKNLCIVFIVQRELTQNRLIEANSPNLTEHQKNTNIKFLYETRNEQFKRCVISLSNIPSKQIIFCVALLIIDV